MPTDAEIWPRVYDELRRLAAAKLPAGHTLDATALVHEAYLRLEDAGFADRSGFPRAAAVGIRRILVDHARRKRAAKRGGAGRRFDLAAGDKPVMGDPDAVLDVDEALGRLAAEDPGSADLARLRLFAGLSVEEAAEALGISRASAFREWAYARSWLTASMAGGASRRPDPSATPG